jgi:hypothetical protein
VGKIKFRKELRQFFTKSNQTKSTNGQQNLLQCELSQEDPFLTSKNINFHHRTLNFSSFFTRAAQSWAGLPFKILFSVKSVHDLFEKKKK